MFKTLLYSLILLFTLNLKAQILLEPYLGYATGGLDPEGSDETVLSSSELDTSGFNLGTKLGWRFADNLHAGLNFHLLTGSYEDKVTTTSIGDYKNSNISVFISYKMPIFARLSFGYVFSSHQEIESDATGMATELDGQGYYIGITYTDLPLVLPIYINFEIHNYSIDEAIDANDSSTPLNDTKATYILFSLSIPLELPLS